MNKQLISLIQSQSESPEIRHKAIYYLQYYDGLLEKYQRNEDRYEITNGRIKDLEYECRCAIVSKNWSGVNLLMR
jgi:hypothetical protein